MFIVSLTYKKSIEEVENFIADHIAFLDKYYAEKKFIFSGRKNPRTGGIILSYHVTKSELEEILKEDPFYQNQIADYEINEIIPTKCAKEFEYFLK